MRNGVSQSVAFKVWHQLRGTIINGFSFTDIKTVAAASGIPIHVISHVDQRAGSTKGQLVDSLTSFIVDADDSDSVIVEFVEEMVAHNGNLTATVEEVIKRFGWSLVAGSVRQPDDAKIGRSKVSGTSSSIRVFVSHSAADMATASAFVDLLRAALPLSSSDIRCTSVDGYRLDPGIVANEQLRKEVFESEAFVALLSPVSLRSMYVTFELGARWGSTRHLAPILVGGLPASDLSEPLRSIHAGRGSSEADVHQLIGALARQLNLTIEPPQAYARALKSFIECAQTRTGEGVKDARDSPGPDAEPPSADLVEDKWVTTEYAERAGIGAKLETEGYSSAWVAGNKEAERVDIDGWEHVTVEGPGGKQYRLKVSDHPVVGGYLVLLKRKKH